MRVFIAYSHKDYWALERLHTHLAMLNREGQIDTWFDREILAGGNLDKEIFRMLKECNLFLLLVSPDFLASDYCYENEMKQALERYHRGNAHVVPIIVEPCDWGASPLSALKAVPRDGKPISTWTNHNNAFVDIVMELRRIIEANKNVAQAQVMRVTTEKPHRETRKYRVKRNFDEIDRYDFRNNAYETIRAHFESSIKEIDSIDLLRGRFTLIGPFSFGCTVVNQARNDGIAHITVHMKNSDIGIGDIYYSYLENAPHNTANGAFVVESGEYELFLKSMMSGFSGKEEKLSPQAAAEQLWVEFVERAGLSCD